MATENNRQPALDWLTAVGWSALGNVVGGLGLVTSIRLLRRQHRVRVERANNH